ncbi:MAG: GPW/gp25 family protein [Rhodospirillaceae bacterium]|nr:GPW/gp25 family protein [Rhodospirillales bacterium]
MAGMDRNTGQMLEGMDHLAQSISDIVSTRIDTRALRRWYGSTVPDIIDSPIHEGSTADFVFAIADGIGRFEDRITVSRVTFSQPAQGRLAVTIEGPLTETGKMAVIGNIVVAR